eukprot:jgi/Psemu1/7698/gm1.7698_g
MLGKGAIAVVCKSKHSRVIKAILEIDKWTYRPLQGDTRKFNNLVSLSGSTPFCFLTKTKISRLTLPNLPMVRKVKASVDKDIGDCIKLADLSQCQREEAELARLTELTQCQREKAELAQAQADKHQREEAKAAEGKIAWRQKEHGCEDEWQTAWVKEAKSWSEDAEFCRIQQEKKQTKGKWNGKNKPSLNAKEIQMKAQGNMVYLKFVDIDVSTKARSIFQFSGRERVYPDYTVPSTLALQEHRIAPNKLLVNLFYDEDIDVYVDGQPTYSSKNMKTILYQIRMIMQTISFQQSVIRSLLLITLQHLLCQLMCRNSNLLCPVFIFNLWKVLTPPPTTD